MENLRYLPAEVIDEAKALKSKVEQMKRKIIENAPNAAGKLEEKLTWFSGSVQVVFQPLY
jgi:hypothetical protein